MKSFSVLSLFALLACASAVQTQITPTTRVVDLLKGLSEQIEKEGKKEEDLYETYVCWAKSIIAQKTKSNSEANSKIDSLETYLADLASGRVELTSERADLEKDIEELMGDLEEAKAIRKKEKADFDVAKDEMTKAIKALDSAIKVLKDATKDHKEGVLMAIRSSLNGGMAAVLEQQAQLQHAVELGERFLTKGDALFLRRMLTGEVPDVDWKKLNRKATFKMSYKARSFKIQDVLKKMHTTFEMNLKDAEDAEDKAIKSYNKLKTSKSDQLDEAQDSLTKMESEGGARGMSKKDTEDEVSDLKEQVKNDVKFIDETEKALEAKKKEWKVRSALRADELQAISKTIGILYNDDSRDLFKKSFDSQVSFIQLRSRSQRGSKAAQVLRAAARGDGNSQLLALAAAAARMDQDGPSVKTKFGPVLGAIEKMIKLLKQNEKDDLKIKEKCEKDRMKDTRKAVLTSRDMDDLTDTITKLTADIAKLEQECKDLMAEKKAVKEELDEATKNRKAENLAWKQTDADDEKAAQTVMDAKNVLEGFYQDKNLMLVQKKQPVSVAGEAPPPPPPTWEAPYGGKTGESSGIIAIMDMVHQDILKDKATAKKEEEDAESEYKEFKKDSIAQMKSLQKDHDAKRKIQGDKLDDKSDAESDRDGKALTLKAVMTKMDGIAPNCEYFAVNYLLRAKNRQIEMDGLLKAQAILKGGTFDEVDENREIKPGDAFLQRK